jgi:hypothetical protein
MASVQEVSGEAVLLSGVLYRQCYMETGRHLYNKF